MLCTAYKYLTQSEATRQQAPLVVVHWTVGPLQAVTIAHHTLIMNYHMCQFVLYCSYSVKKCDAQPYTTCYRYCLRN